MIKRYSLTSSQASSDNSASQGAGVFECENGEFVRYEDVKALLEAVEEGDVDALDVIIDRSKSVASRLKKDYESALTENELDLACALKAASLEIILMGSLAKKLKRNLKLKH